MSRPTTRVLELLELLQDRGRVSGPELAARLGVDLRTVRRYVAKLEELGLPVDADRGRNGGYRLAPGWKLPPLMLSDDEATAVVLGLLAARRDGLATAAPAVDGALEKVRRVLPAELRERVRALEAALGFSQRRGEPTPPAIRDERAAAPPPARTPAPAPPAGVPAPPATETVLALADAIARERRVEIAYADRAGSRSTRQLDPYGIVFHHGRWYLSAHDHGRDALRTLRLDRIASVRLLRRAAPPPAGFDPVAAVARALARVPWRWEVEVVLDASLAELRAQLPPHAAELEPREDGVLLRARAERLDGMARLLAGLGAPLRVIGPPELRDELARLADRLAAAAAAG
ncbi:helix-turn-helix transcriptional regulator [Conexibacter arvalis]|uniref:Putative DNA-binding transcriptional regulator YafY n=1 Tax=Conexibacter arvalis TaxID=912552 RepID=A0A840IFG4_9ACTN|nr:YafY family protein [Conexibacter arvalis]MBB4663546.1 putative DNA-binding transcriptional regulator YafY [Conexibacter arvalis]